jgi:class 3 adenylate cyclase/tetratricopeptide (TPR) repeat protein
LEAKGVEQSGASLATYVPTWVISSLWNPRASDSAPFAMKRTGAVLFLDIADFAAQTGRFEARGARGAEDLSSILNGYFSILTDTINECGGDIVAFAGDGLLVLWDQLDVQAAALVATNCALAFQEALVKRANLQEQDLRLRVSIDVGEVLLCQVGGFDGRWRHLVVGNPVLRACAAYRKAGPGQVVLCPAAWAAVGDQCTGRVVDGSFLQVINSAPRSTGMPQSLSGNVPPETLRNLLPQVVMDRATFGDGRWLAEFRTLSIVSIKLGIVLENGFLDKLQSTALTIQTLAARFEGHVLDILMSDKGIVSIIVFGLPPMRHSDDAMRAVEAAWTLRTNLTNAGVASSIGVATGRLFCGVCGGKARREYSVIGQTINLSARLMELAKDDVLCDGTTSTSLDRRIRFSSLGKVQIKGWIRPMAVYRPEAVPSPHRRKPLEEIFGRDVERAILAGALTDALGSRGRFLIVQGEPGIGKSQLLTDLVEKARSQNLFVCQGFAAAIEKSTLYFAWREPTLRLIGVAASAEPTRVQEKLVATLAGESQLLNWLPLLEDVVHVGLPPSGLTQSITGAARAACIEQLVIHLLKQSVLHRPTLLVFEDLHWFDDASAALLASVARRVPEILLVASRRSQDPAAVVQSRAFLDAQLLKLDALSAAAVADLVHCRLGVSVFPVELLDFVYRHGGGNPFFCEELLLALRDTGAIRLEHGNYRITGDLTAASHSGLSASVEGAIVSRIDALPQPHQMALKIASAIGIEFSSQTLRTLYPTDATVVEVQTIIDRLVALELLDVQCRDEQNIYDFRHAIIRRVTYDQLSFAQRQTLHRDIANYLEDTNYARLEPLYAQLALHRELADQPAEAIQYLELAANQALRNYANQDAIGYTTRAQHLAEAVAVVVDDQRRSAWKIILGDACHELRNYEEASRHYADALWLLGRAPPASTAKTVRSLLVNAAWQAGSRIRGTTIRSALSAQSEAARRAAHVYERLAEEYFYLNDPLRLLHGTLASVNLAERSGSVPEVISGYNGLALGLGMSGLTRASRFYSDRAFRLARERGGKPEIARANLVAGTLASGLGQRSLAQSYGIEAAAGFRELGDRPRLQNVLAGLVFEHLIHGDVKNAESLLDEISLPDLNDTSDTVRAWHLCARAVIGTTRSEADAALLSDLRSVASGPHAFADRLLCFGILASAHERRGELRLGLEAAERGFDLLQNCRVVWAAYGTYGAAGVVGTLLAHWERASRAGFPDSGGQAKSRRGCSLLYRAARTSPVCRPAALLMRGTMSLLSGRTHHARRDWHRAVVCAEKLDMPYFAGLAWRKIGKSIELDDPARALALAQAGRAFQAVGAVADLADVQADPMNLI